MSPLVDAMCPEVVDDVWKIQWTDTAVGSTQSVPCVEDEPELGLASRACQTDGKWGSVDATKCQSAKGNLVKTRVRQTAYCMCLINKSVP